MSASASKFFTAQQLDDIKHSILDAELDTSGEIRVHLENTCSGDVLDRAAYVFQKLGMADTDLRNGVLIYLAVKNRRFAIIGDTGINQVVESDYWERLKVRMANFFREGRFAEGLEDAIYDIGQKLKLHFPYKKGDVNELSDEISFEEQL